MRLPRRSATRLAPDGRSEVRADECEDERRNDEYRKHLSTMPCPRMSKREFARSLRVAHVLGTRSPSRVAL